MDFVHLACNTKCLASFGELCQLVLSTIQIEKTQPMRDTSIT